MTLTRFRTCPDSSVSRHRLADSNTSSIDFPVCRSARSWRSTEISASSADPISSALVAQTSFQMSAGLDARRVVSCRPRPLRLEALVARRLSDDVHQRADGELREVADEGEQAIVFFGRERLRNGAEAGRQTTSASRAPGRRAPWSG